MNRTDRHHGETRTDDRPTDSRPTDSRPTDTESTSMAEVSHSHPYADRDALKQLFERGPVVAADGGRRDAREENEEDEKDEREAEQPKPRMKDVNHEPPYGEGVDRVFERGGKEEPVESEE
jgi:hypothetical protein